MVIFVFVYVGIYKDNKNSNLIYTSRIQISSKSPTKLQNCLRNCLISYFAWQVYLNVTYASHIKIWSHLKYMLIGVCGKLVKFIS